LSTFLRTFESLRTMGVGGPSCGYAALNCADTRAISPALQRQSAAWGRRLLHERAQQC
jgi:hypothetical protein